MENAAIVRLQLNYDLLKAQRDDAMEHILLCSEHHDDDMFHYWCKIHVNILEDMARVHQEIAKYFPKDNG